MPTITLARHAMATRFEIVLHGENPVALRAAGEEALAEIDRLESQLSLYLPTSEIAHLNARAARQPVKVTPSLLGLLQHAQKLHQETGGTFDITIAPLVRCWGFMGGTGRIPTPEEVAHAKSNVGMQHVLLNGEDFTVRFAREGVMIDLGAIGKGYAIDQAADILREAGVRNALIHGGTSTVLAMGRTPEGGPWKIAIENPLNQPAIQQTKQEEQIAPLVTIDLENEALSVSAVWGRCFEAGGKVFGHVLDPRTGQPTSNGVLAVVVLPSATETDALSTALLTMGEAGHEQVSTLRHGMRTWLATRENGQIQLKSYTSGARNSS